jgi:hypothetical protein
MKMQHSHILKHLKLFINGFAQVTLFTANTYFISQANYLLTFIFTFITTIIWCKNVQTINKSTRFETIIYSLGCGFGGLLGLYAANLLLR